MRRLKSYACVWTSCSNAYHNHECGRKTISTQHCTCEFQMTSPADLQRVWSKNYFKSALSVVNSICQLNTDEFQMTSPTDLRWVWPKAYFNSALSAVEINCQFNTAVVHCFAFCHCIIWPSTCERTSTNLQSVLQEALLAGNYTSCDNIEECSASDWHVISTYMRPSAYKRAAAQRLVHASPYVRMYWHI